jgi:hypothetical protein
VRNPRPRPSLHPQRPGRGGGRLAGRAWRRTGRRHFVRLDGHFCAALPYAALSRAGLPPPGLPGAIGGSVALVSGQAAPAEAHRTAGPCPFPSDRLPYRVTLGVVGQRSIHASAAPAQVGFVTNPSETTGARAGVAPPQVKLRREAAEHYVAMGLVGKCRTQPPWPRADAGPAPGGRVLPLPGLGWAGLGWAGGRGAATG